MNHKKRTESGPHLMSTMLKSREVTDLLESSVGSDLQGQLLYVLLLRIAQEDECC